MKCPECVKQNVKSNVYPHGGTSTLMHCPPYYDSEGKLHSHDANIHTTYYSCSNGHSWIETEKPACPTCGKDW